MRKGERTEVSNGTERTLVITFPNDLQINRES